MNHKRRIPTLICIYVLLTGLLVLGISTQARAQETPGTGRDAGTEAASPAKAGVGGYLVQPGDTLSRISARLGTSVDYLAGYNRIADPDVIYSGQTLRFELRELRNGSAEATGESAGEAATDGEQGAGEEGMRPDEPDKAAALRFSQDKNEKGVIPKGALVKAAKKAKSMKHKPIPGAKPVSRNAAGAAQPSTADTTPGTAGAAQPTTAGTVQPSTANIDRSLWNWIGPGNVGGRVRSIVIDPTNPQTMWAGSVGGGIWKTTNGGAYWRPLDDFMANLAVSTLVIDPRDHNVLYAGTGEGVYNSDALIGAGVFKSTDGGKTWNQLSSTATSDFYYVNRLAISPNNSRVLIAATSTGILRSVDGGTTWSRKLSVNNVFLQVAFNPNDGTKAVASGKWGWTYYSTDGGFTWTSATKPWNTNNRDIRVEFAYAPSNPNIVYASVNQSDGLIYKSTDGGRNYSLVSKYYSYLASAAGNQGWYDNALWVSPTNSNFLIVGGIDLWRSTDGGQTLTQISDWNCGGFYGAKYCNGTSSAHADQHAIVSAPGYNGTTNKTLFFGNDGGIYKASDISTVSQYSGWQELNNNFGVTQFYGGAGNTTSGTVVGGAQDNGSLTGKGDTEGWTEMSGGDGGFSAADPTDPGYFYGEYTYLNVLRSGDSGSSSNYISGQYWNGASWVWKPAPYTIPDARNQTALFISPFILDPNNSNRMLAGGQSLWRTNDAKTPNTSSSGPSWASIKGPISGVEISAVAVAKGNANIIWVGYNNGELYKTTNGTAATPTWTQVDSAATPGRYVTRITIDPRNPNVVYATFGGFSPDNVWRTTNGGSTWTDITGSGTTSLPDAPVRSLVVNPNNSNWLYVGTEVGVFASEDGGAHWATATDGPANVSVDELFWMGNKLVAATHGRGMYVADTQAVRPANNDFANAQGLTGTSATATGTNVNASKETGEPDHAGNIGGRSVWYKWTPQATGNTTISTAGSTDAAGTMLDTVLGVYKGDAVSALTGVASNDDENNPGSITTSKVTFQATAGTTYRIAVDGYNDSDGKGAASGNIKLALASDGVPSNPTATLTAPADGAVVNGLAVNISADASDDVGVSKVEFLVDGQVVATDTTAPYSTSWDSTTRDDGFTNIMARASDAAGNVGTSAVRKVAVNNTTPDTAITGGPADGGTSTSDTASFIFSSTERDSTFRCKLDDAAFAACPSPKAYASLAAGSHTFQVKAVGSGGEPTDSDATPASRTWTVNKPPTADTTAPTVTLATPADGATYARGQRVLAAYSCSDEQGGSGMKSCNGTVPNSSAINTSTTGARSFAVTATDNAGNTKTLTHYYKVVAPRIYQESNPNFNSYGGWSFYSNSNFSGRYASYSNIKGRSATFRFRGTSIAWKTNRMSDDGKTTVYLDGKMVKVFDGYSSRPIYNVTGFSKGRLPNRLHTLRLVVTGAKNAASKDRYIEIDRFVAEGKSFQENNPRVQYGTWRGLGSRTASGGTYRTSSSKADTALFYYFSGPELKLITARGPGYGRAEIKVFTSNGRLVKILRPSLYATTRQWRSEIRITGLDPSQKYYMNVRSYNGRPVVVDAYSAFPPQAATAQPAVAVGVGAVAGGASKPAVPPSGIGN